MLNTLDLDRIDKEEFDRILKKINNNSCCKKTEWRYSNSKGYHVIIECLKECDVCRLVFDDDKRFAVDSVMPLRLRDFLFSEKIYLGNKKITKENLDKIMEII